MTLARFRRSALLLALSAGLFSTGRAAFAASKDALAKANLAAARKTSAAGNAGASEKKLRETLEACGAEDCSPAVQAELHRDIAVILADFRKLPEDAKQSFLLALALDPQLTLPSALATPAVTAAFQAAKGPATGAAAASAGTPPAPPPPPPPPPPEPKPLREVQATKARFQTGLGLTIDTDEQQPPRRGATGPGPIVAARTRVTGAWVQQFAIGYVQLAFRPSIDGVEPCNYLHSHGLVGDFEFDRHLPGTVVGHRLRIGMGVALGAAESPEDCGGIRRGPAYWPVAFTYGLDIHAPLPGILHGLSLGPFLGPQAQIFIADKLTNDKSSKATDTAVNLAALGGAHLRFRYGRPEIGFHAYADVSYFYRQGIVEKSWTGVYRRAELKLAYKSVGLLGFWEERVDASGGESGGPNVAALLARTASLAAMRGVALTIDY